MVKRVSAKAASDAYRRSHGLLPPLEKKGKKMDETNVCEHGDHPAPEGKRFCSKECKACETAEADHTKVECAGICLKRKP